MGAEGRAPRQSTTTHPWANLGYPHTRLPACKEWAPIASHTQGHEWAPIAPRTQGHEWAQRGEPPRHSTTPRPRAACTQGLGLLVPEPLCPILCGRSWVTRTRGLGLPVHKALGPIVGGSGPSRPAGSPSRPAGSPSRPAGSPSRVYGARSASNPPEPWCPSRPPIGRPSCAISSDLAPASRSRPRSFG